VEACDRVPLVADPVRIRQTIGNLVSNALHYTPPNGTVTVRVRREPGSATVAIEVADTGIGISPEHLAHL
jgi:two-component system sensor histidine kinase BaeS